MKWKVPLYKIYWDEEDVKSVSDAIRRGMFWAIGSNIEQFEKMVSEYVGMKYAVAFNSGTSALHAILLAHGIGDGDEVIVPSFTFIATANSVLFVGATPVFSDIEEKTLGLDSRDVEQKISKKTKAIIPIHYGGLPCQINALRKVADEHGLLLFEDAAESLGANIHGKKVGSFGDESMFSFCANKIVTTGEGGMILTDSKEIYEKMKLLRSHGRLETENYFTSANVMDYVALGFNWRMSNITAALGVSQMKKLEEVIYMRRKIAEYFNQQLSNVKGIELFEEPPNYKNVYQLYTIKVVEGAIKRNALQQYLTENGIGTKIYFNPVHLTHFYTYTRRYTGETLRTTEKLSQQVLSLPIYPSLTNDEVGYIVNVIKAFFSESDKRNE